MTAYKTTYLKSKWNWNQLKTNKCCKNDSPSSYQTWFGIAKTSELLLNFCSYPFINRIYNFIPFLYEMKSVFVCVFKESFLFEFNDISKGKHRKQIKIDSQILYHVFVLILLQMLILRCELD